MRSKACTGSMIFGSGMPPASYDSVSPVTALSVPTATSRLVMCVLFPSPISTARN